MRFVVAHGAALPQPCSTTPCLRPALNTSSVFTLCARWLPSAPPFVPLPATTVPVALYDCFSPRDGWPAHAQHGTSRHTQFLSRRRDVLTLFLRLLAAHRCVTGPFKGRWCPPSFFVGGSGFACGLAVAAAPAAQHSRHHTHTHWHPSWSTFSPLRVLRYPQHDTNTVDVAAFTTLTYYIVVEICISRPDQKKARRRSICHSVASLSFALSGCGKGTLHRWAHAA